MSNSRNKGLIYECALLAEYTLFSEKNQIKAALFTINPIRKVLEVKKNIKLDFKQNNFEGMNWFQLAVCRIQGCTPLKENKHFIYVPQEESLNCMKSRFLEGTVD